MDETDFPDPGELPVIDWVKKDLIDVDSAYQRPEDAARAGRIAAGFSWRKFGAVVLVPKEGGRFNVVDGQHRVGAALLHPRVTDIPAVIMSSVQDVAGAAESFIGINAERKSISPLDRYWAELAASDEDAQTVSQVTARAGITVQRYPSADYQPGQTIAISAIRAVVENRGAMRGREILEVLAKAELAPIKGEHIRAAEVLMTDDEFRHEVEPEALAEAMAKHWEDLATEGKAFAKTHCMPAARALASVWFRKTRKRRKAAQGPGDHGLSNVR